MAERRGLGKGLSALIPTKEKEDVVFRKEDVIYLKVNDIKSNPYQPRADFDNSELEDLVASIKEKGIIQPVLVRRIPNGYELIAGERRLRAAKALNIEDVPAIIKNVNNEGSLEIALIENIQRQNLNPIEEALAFKHLLDHFNFTQEKIAQSVGKARVSIANTLRLLKLHPQVQEILRKGQLSFAHGKILLEIPDTHKQLLLAHQAISKRLSVKELENLVLRQQKVKNTKSAVSRIPPQLKAVEEELQQALGTKVRISVNHKRGGSISIEFYSQEDLERIYKQIKK